MFKKGQMEIMGLAVIVVLLALAMFFVVAFKSNGPETTSVQKTYSDKELATNFIVTLIDTHIGCEKLTIDDLIHDCAVDNKIYCQGKKSCEFLDDSINLLLDETLKKWGVKYNLTIEETTEPLTFVNDCSAYDETRVVGFQPIPLFPDRAYNAIIKLKICKS